MRVIFTGGSGRVARYVVQELVKFGHEILNLDLTKLGDPDVHTMNCDLTDSGQVFGCLSTYMKLSEPFPSEPPRPPDAVVHFAALSRPMIVSDGETFRSNVMGAQNIIEAACKLGIKKIIFASSIATYGVAFGRGRQEYPSFPVEEHLDVIPTDTYALSKLVGELVAKSYAKKFGVDIYCLRIGRVIEPHEYNSVFENYVYRSEDAFAQGWSYTDSRDLGQMCHRALQVSGLGWQIFNATNDTITNLTPTTELLTRFYPHIPITRKMGEFEAPVTNKKIKQLLGFKEEHDWRKYFTLWRDGINRRS
jgi:nucleoside-diphosphate-sugar epimerase